MIALASMLFSQAIPAQTDLSPVKQAEVQLNAASEHFEAARSDYSAGKIHEGDARLEEMTKALNACLENLGEAHKSSAYKKAEIRVATLQRRLATLVEDIDLQNRGWAEFTSRKLAEIHERMLEGAMRK